MIESPACARFSNLASLSAAYPSYPISLPVLSVSPSRHRTVSVMNLCRMDPGSAFSCHPLSLGPRFVATLSLRRTYISLTQFWAPLMEVNEKSPVLGLDRG